VVTGNLKSSIIAKPEGKLRWVVNVGAPYGISLEYGTHNMAARPFLLPAVMAVVKDAPKKLVEVVNE
jgi:HK97 gp10 family phage protein